MITILSKPYRAKYGTQIRTYVICECNHNKPNDIDDLPVIFQCLLDNIKRNRTKSCGCTIRKHGLESHPLYKVWKNMMDRCYNINNLDYHNYGGRGITVCNQWHDLTTFYYDNINKWKKGLTIDRINNETGNYEPSNCKFNICKKQQNNRRNNRRLTIFNENKTMKEWSEDSRCMVSYNTLQRRLNLKWNTERALITCLNQK